MRLGRRSKLAAVFEAGRRSGLAEGRLLGQLDQLPFAGVHGIAPFPTSGDIHARVAEYETRLLHAIPIAHALEELARRETASITGSSTLPDAWPIEMVRARLIRESPSFRPESPQNIHAHPATVESILAELENARQWLDEFVLFAKGYNKERPNRRVTQSPANPPSEVVQYQSVEVFVAEDSRREARRDGKSIVLDGSDFGYNWSHIEASAPWITTKWRVSYIDKLGELYAERTSKVDLLEYAWTEENWSETLPRVWLLARGKPQKRTSLLSENEVWKELISLERKYMRENNSLILLAEATKSGLPGPR
ncbi:hypothetical protein ACWFRB_02865 [Rhodococcus sp. NPDC055112]